MKELPQSLSSSPRRRRNQTRWSKIAPYALISLVCLLCGVGLLSLMIWNADKLVALGLIGNLYYVVLLPLGLCAAIFLFGILRSYARYEGKVLEGTLEISGPAVIFLLVVIGGFFLPPPQVPFSMTIFVHGEQGVDDLVLKNSGYVLLDLGPDRRKQPIGERGEAYFSGIPASFRGQKVHIWVDSERFKTVGAEQMYPLETTSLYLAIRPKDGEVYGRVQDTTGRSLEGVEIRVAGLSTKSNRFGDFKLSVPGDRMSEELELEAVASGYAPGRYRVAPNAKATILLSRGK